MPASISANINILLIGSQPLFCAGLRLHIENSPGMTVVGESRTLADALEMVPREKPNIILLDIDIGKYEALDLLARIRTVANGARIILLTSTFDSELCSSAIRSGAKGLVLKDWGAELFIKAIKKVHAGEVWLDRSVMADVIDQISNQSKPFKADPETCAINLLTERELEVIRVVCEGLKNKQIAERLVISESTVRHHLTSIFNKLNVSDRFTLVLYAFRQGLVAPPH
jgi:DNA-binding NarL/FixJ family response regulator